MTLRVQLLSLAKAMKFRCFPRRPSQKNLCRPRCSFGAQRNLGSQHSECRTPPPVPLIRNPCVVREPGSAPGARRGRGRPGGCLCPAAAGCAGRRFGGRRCTQCLRRLAKTQGISRPQKGQGVSETEPKGHGIEPSIPCFEEQTGQRSQEGHPPAGTAPRRRSPEQSPCVAQLPSAT